MIILSDQNYRDYLMGNILIDLWRARSESCRYNAPLFQELSEEFKECLKFGKLNVEDNPYFIGTFGIKIVPSIVLFRDCKLFKSFYGIINKEEISYELNKICTRG